MESKVTSGPSLPSPAPNVMNANIHDDELPRVSSCIRQVRPNPPGSLHRETTLVWRKLQICFHSHPGFRFTCGEIPVLHKFIICNFFFFFAIVQAFRLGFIPFQTSVYTTFHHDGIPIPPRKRNIAYSNDFAFGGQTNLRPISFRMINYTEVLNPGPIVFGSIASTLPDFTVCNFKSGKA